MLAIHQLTQWYNQSTPLLVEFYRHRRHIAAIPFTISTLIDYGGIVEIGATDGAVITLDLAHATVRHSTLIYPSGIAECINDNGRPTGGLILQISPIDTDFPI